jgi:hypothetical protein
LLKKEKHVGQVLKKRRNDDEKIVGNLITKYCEGI